MLEKTGGTFDGGAGNLCANCHQIRNDLPVATDGNIEITSVRFGTHYGVESQMLLGEGGAAGVTGSPSTHYTTVKDTCVACHMGEEFNHTYAPAVERCTACHADAENFDMNGVQTEVTAMLAEVKAKLMAKGILGEDDLAVPGTYPEAVATALWNYKLVEYDGSAGVHNSKFAKALLQAALDALK